ncbi:unnamed protein product [Acanthoscelides obtectus]|uniref:Gamma-interferon-inducible lysosomal thiol reductase n=1 Tax=Acanthoscelides obtectus TaxID=200917 RepID=A0A9P0LMU6_ACAOB|nr:unnamed protein product [Acanthoscelides obtectus]CAK1645115.1 GILT-like protein 1 [Acanthoscelides obtectus]
MHVTGKGAAHKVKVSLYYEALCGGCSYFIHSQLKPVYKELKDHVQLDLVPFGNARFRKVGSKWQFMCQHGPEECYGNIIHACALDSSPVEVALDFIACCEGQKFVTSDKTFQKCSKKAGLKFEDLKKCKETKGDDLLAAYGKRSKPVGYPWVPFITINDKYDENVSMNAMYDLKSVLCEHLKDDPPKACSKKTIDAVDEISVCRA